MTTELHAAFFTMLLDHIPISFHLKCLFMTPSTFSKHKNCLKHNCWMILCRCPGFEASRHFEATRYKLVWHLKWTYEEPMDFFLGKILKKLFWRTAGIVIGWSLGKVPWEMCEMYFMNNPTTTLLRNFRKNTGHISLCRGNFGANPGCKCKWIFEGIYMKMPWSITLEITEGIL